MELWNEKKDCCGCGACAAACPRGCIQMRADEEGCLYPFIDGARCTGCGLCQKACPMGSQPSGGLPEAYALINGDGAVRRDSTSGGVFTLLAEAVLETGGLVFGAAMQGDMTVRHVAAERPQELAALRGSKYVQSDTGDTYRQAKQYLTEGRTVLYTGTPCQISGLKGYLGKDYVNLICQDVICHGAPAPAVWQRYVAHREGKAGAKCSAVSFRCKEPDWVDYSLRMTFENGAVYQATARQDPYLRAFLRDLSLRPSCYHCSFKGESRPADLTLGDFWGVWGLEPQLHDGKGTSLVLVHSEKGRRLLESVLPKTRWKTVDPQPALAHNPSVTRAPAQPPSRAAFRQEIGQEDFAAVVDRHCPRMSPLKRLIKRGKRFLKKHLCR